MFGVFFWVLQVRPPVVVPAQLVGRRVPERTARILDEPLPTIGPAAGQSTG